MKSWYEPYLKLRREMDGWAEQTRRMDPPGPHGGGEDEANYALAFFPHYLVTGSPDVKVLFDDLFANLAGWVERECLHGYEAEAEAHHGIEPFLLFLPRYEALFKDQRAAGWLLDGAAEHIGNWVPEIPAWYDYARERFYGYHLGTKVVRQDAEQAYELAEHFRFIHVALAAYRTTGKERYLTWALRYGRARAKRILEAPQGPLPVMWNPEGQPVWEADLTKDSQKHLAASGHHAAVANVHASSRAHPTVMTPTGLHPKGDPLAGVENMLASGALGAFADLFSLEREALFRDAARRVAEPLVAQLGDPYADPAAAALACFRRAFEDASLDAALRRELERLPEAVDGEWVLLARERRVRDDPGVGRRGDMLRWGYWRPDGAIAPTHEPSTAALTLAWELTGREEFARRALDQAARKLLVAKRILRGGREHADMGGAIASVAAGHGRNWGIGAVTGCYGPLVLGTHESMGAIRSLMEVRRADQSAGLPAEIGALVLPRGPERSTAEARFFNGGAAALTFSWRVPEGAWHVETLEAGTGVTRSVEG